MRAQIKPHFLYNAMNTFISISRYDMETARQRMADFSEYLRRSFDIKGSGQLALLSEEIKLTQAYLKIEQARFENRIMVTYELPKRQDVMVPAIMLQPIVENAVVHGILPKPEGGRIDIKIENEKNRIRFLVKDSGVGISEQELDQITKKETNGVGLSNIIKRLKALYKKDLNIRSTVGKGTEVSWEVLLGVYKDDPGYFD